VRLFLAIDFEPAAREGLAAVQTALRTATGAGANDLRWTDPGTLHLTLHFLGEVDAAGLERLRTSLGDALPDRPFTLRTGAPGCFPARGPVRVIWLGMAEGGPETTAIHGELAARIRRAGLVVEPRPLTPHLTLARARDPRRSARDLRDRVAACHAPVIASRVDRVVLYESDLSGPRPRYTALATLALAGA